MIPDARFVLAQIGLAVVLAIAAAAPAHAQARHEFVGPGKCTDCHEHRDEKEWSEKRDGDGKGKQHLNALNQLGDAKADQYAKATAVADVYDPKSMCVRCHATIVRGSADFGVSCESCHGAGKDFLKPHQDKGSYQAAVGLGMKDTQNKPETWLRECVSCHVLGQNPGEAALIKAGHSSGADFDFGVKFQPVAAHFSAKYTAGQISGLANPLRNAMSRTAASAPAPAAAPAAAPPPAAAPAAPPVAAPATAAGTKPAPAAAPAAPPPARATTPAPTPAPAAAPPAATRAAAPPPLPALPPPAPAAPSPVIATVLDAPVSQSPASLVGALQGRVAQLLSDLLARGVRTPVKLNAPATKTQYRGADAELLRLQEEVIGLALEALGTAPAARTQPPK